MASMTFSSVTSTSFTAEVTDLDTGYARDDRSVDWYLGSAKVSSSSLSAHASSTSCSFSGLTPNTDYTVSAHIHYSSTPTSGVDMTKVISGRHMTKPGSPPPPDPEPERPGYFYWDTAKTSGAKFNLTASEWNRLINNINSVRSYLGYSNASFSKAVAGNEFTAKMFNQARSAIISISGFSGYISQASSGGKVYANMLNALQGGINGLG